MLNLLPTLADKFGREFVDRMTPATTYESCMALRKDYPDGVGTSQAVSSGAKAQRVPAVDDRVCEANASLDKNDDGLVCERKDGP